MIVCTTCEVIASVAVVGMLELADDVTDGRSVEEVATDVVELGAGVEGADSTELSELEDSTELSELDTSTSAGIDS